MSSAVQAGPPLAPRREDSREAPLWPPQPRNTVEEAIWPGQGVARTSTFGYHVGGKSPALGTKDLGMGLLLQTRGVERCLSPLLGVELSELLSGTLFLENFLFLSTLDPIRTILFIHEKAS